jgi:hypothetical protein
MTANTNSSAQPDPDTFDGRRRGCDTLADTPTRRDITVRAVWPGDVAAPRVVYRIFGVVGVGGMAILQLERA